jgi:hypothetical protein
MDSNIPDLNGRMGRRPITCKPRYDKTIATEL